MIDIIIPAYNAHDTIEKSLLSILIQSEINNINVYIVNDCSKNDYSYFIKKYKNYMNIHELKLKKNKGPGFARNYGIKHSNGKYIFFLDSDDMIYSHFSIKLLFDTIENQNVDVVVSSFAQEIDYNNYISINTNNIWNHGKMYRREFLEKNSIYFNEKRTNEDLYFNYMVELIGAKYFYINDITYIWQNNDKSITRCNNNEYRYKALLDYNSSILNVVMDAENRNIAESQIAKVLFFGIVQMYYAYLRFIESNEIEYAKKLLDSIKENVCKYDYYKDKIIKEDKLNILKNELEKSFNSDLDSLVFPKVSFEEFLKKAVIYE